MENLSPAQVAASQAIEILGGTVNAARLLNVKDHRHQTVQSWLKNRVPAEYCPLIERETRAAGRPIPCERLRPDIAWDVLRTKNKPKAA